jgi:NAD+ diphosphatase
MDPLIVDRAGHLRAKKDPAAAFAVVVHDGKLLVQGDRLVELEPGSHPASALTVYLGREGDRDLVALVPEEPELLPASGESQWMGLRDALRLFANASETGDRDRELGSTAVAIATWHANHPRCSVCGDPTVPTSGGWVRHCERDDRDHYPRTDPAVIVAITDADDRLLMAHASYWPAGRFSHLAGYVEPGESFEQAAHREVFEEASLKIHGLEYAGSQPWPFPASIMVGFTARTDDPQFTLDDDEITEAHFVSRAELVQRMADGTMIAAPSGSIARRMMEDWYGGPLD